MHTSGSTGRESSFWRATLLARFPLEKVEMSYFWAMWGSCRGFHSIWSMPFSTPDKTYDRDDNSPCTPDKTCDRDNTSPCTPDKTYGRDDRLCMIILPPQLMRGRITSESERHTLSYFRLNLYGMCSSLYKPIIFFYLYIPPSPKGCSSHMRQAPADEYECKNMTCMQASYVHCCQQRPGAKTPTAVLECSLSIVANQGASGFLHFTARGPPNTDPDPNETSYWRQ